MTAGVTQYARPTYQDNNEYVEVSRERQGSKDSLYSTPTSSESGSNPSASEEPVAARPSSTRLSSSAKHRLRASGIHGSSTKSMRDSLMLQSGRQTEMGNDLMRMDKEYRRTGSFRRSSSNGLSPLIHAARDGDLVLLNALIVQPGTDILRRDPQYGQTALHFAIRGGHLPVVQSLLMPQIANSIVNIPDNRRNTALHLASAKSRRMTKVLLENGGDVNFLNMRNQTPLGVHILTITRDDPSMAEILLQNGADPNAPLDKSTVLHVALDKNLLQIAAELVRRGARLDLKDEQGRMVFDKVDPGLLRKLLSQVAHPPVWIRDDERAECMECAKRFSALSARRHHCRYCGRLLCSSCADCLMKVQQMPFKSEAMAKTKRKEQRVCKTCYDVFAHGA